jgi:hypothetical protein
MPGGDALVATGAERRQRLREERRLAGRVRPVARRAPLLRRRVHVGALERRRVVAREAQLRLARAQPDLAARAVRLVARVAAPVHEGRVGRASAGQLGADPRLMALQARAMLRRRDGRSGRGLATGRGRPGAGGEQDERGEEASGLAQEGTRVGEVPSVCHGTTPPEIDRPQGGAGGARRNPAAPGGRAFRGPRYAAARGDREMSVVSMWGSTRGWSARMMVSEAPTKEVASRATAGDIQSNAVERPQGRERSPDRRAECWS